MGLAETLFVVFLVLKLLGHIDWSWWAVFSPLLVAAAIYVIILCVYIVTAVFTRSRY